MSGRTVGARSGVWWHGARAAPTPRNRSHCAYARVARSGDHGRLHCHPYVIGEIGVGVLKQRHQVLELLAALPSAPVVSHEDAMTFVEQRRLAGRGVGWVESISPPAPS